MKKLVRFSFLILLILSCLIVVPGCLLQTYLPDTATTATTTTTTTTTTMATTTTTMATTTTTMATTTTTTMATGSTAGSSAVITQQPTSSATLSSATQTTVTTASTTLPSATQQTTPTKPSARSFPKTLFIGDSRTDGLRLYGKITDATFFCKQSMTAYTALAKKFPVNGKGEFSLEETLANNQFDYVYIMLGLNELYKSLDSITEKYREIITTIHAKQPNATVVVQATLHVTEKKSNESTFTNTRINDLNTRLATLADNQHVFFIDPNPAFDDANGNMCADYSKDGVHYYGKYYPLWSAFLDANRRTATN